MYSPGCVIIHNDLFKDGGDDNEKRFASIASSYQIDQAYDVHTPWQS